MGAGNFGSPLQLLILLAIVLLLFGGKRLRNLGSDLGGAIKGFKNSMTPADHDTNPKSINNEPPQLLTTATELQKNQHKVNN